MQHTDLRGGQWRQLSAQNRIRTRERCSSLLLKSQLLAQVLNPRLALRQNSLHMHVDKLPLVHL